MQSQEPVASEKPGKRGLLPNAYICDIKCMWKMKIIYAIYFFLRAGEEVAGGSEQG